MKLIEDITQLKKVAEQNGEYFSYGYVSSSYYERKWLVTTLNKSGNTGNVSTSKDEFKNDIFYTEDNIVKPDDTEKYGEIEGSVSWITRPITLKDESVQAIAGFKLIITAKENIFFTNDVGNGFLIPENLFINVNNHHFLDPTKNTCAEVEEYINFQSEFLTQLIYNKFSFELRRSGLRVENDEILGEFSNAYDRPLKKDIKNYISMIDFVDQNKIKNILEVIWVQLESKFSSGKEVFK